MAVSGGSRLADHLSSEQFKKTRGREENPNENRETCYARAGQTDGETSRVELQRKTFPGRPLSIHACVHFDHKKVKTTLLKIQILEREDSWESTWKNTGHIDSKLRKETNYYNIQFRYNN